VSDRVPPLQSGASRRSAPDSSSGAPGDTIVALSTASGTGAIGIVRLSGVDAVPVAEQAFRPAHPPDLAGGRTHVMRYGHVVDPLTGRTVDEALAVVMRAPATYTREDVVEIHCHGGPAAQRAVLRVVVGLGARPAEPGEFTKRAFLHGRIDLTQAESVAGIVQARSASALRASVRQLDGGLADRVRGLRADLVAVLAGMEVAIDFSDEDVDEIDAEGVDAGLASIEGRLTELLSTALLGRALEQGVRTAIVGRPNVGKSSLLNALLMRERAIVSEFPGTTRDTVEELVEIAGIPLCLVDTAGLRASDDHVERMGIERSRQALEQADLVLVVLDLTDGVTPEDEELLAAVPQARTIVVGNKRDLVEAGETAGAERDGVVSRASGMDAAGEWIDAVGKWTVCEVSARTGSGVDHLRRAIETIVVGDNGLQLEEPLLATERQRSLVEQSLAAVVAARAGMHEGVSVELICDDVRRSAEALGRITGEDLVLDLVDELFRRFCIGK
jgi:tRNA modification GTPase